MKVLLDVPLHEPGLAALQKLGGVEFVHLESAASDPPRRVLDPARVGDAEVLLCQNLPKNLADLRALRWVQVMSTGYDQLIGLGLAERGIRATNSRGCCDVQIAEWNLGMMINLVRDVRQLLSNQDAAVWDRNAAPQGEIRGRTVGFWGYGGFARETARLARHHGLRVHAYTRHGPRNRDDTYRVEGTGDPTGALPHQLFSPGQETAFLAGLDFLVIGLPLTRVTDGLIGERELQALPRRAFVLNPARGKIIQEAALLRALQEKWIAGAALDTHHHYPMPSDHPFWQMRNVIMTPHLAAGGATPRFVERFWDLFAQNVEHYAKGRALLNELTLAELSGE